MVLLKVIKKRWQVQGAVLSSTSLLSTGPGEPKQNEKQHKKKTDFFAWDFHTSFWGVLFVPFQQQASQTLKEKPLIGLLKNFYHSGSGFYPNLENKPHKIEGYARWCLFLWFILFGSLLPWERFDMPMNHLWQCCQQDSKTGDWKDNNDGEFISKVPLRRWFYKYKVVYY